MKLYCVTTLLFVATMTVTTTMAMVEVSLTVSFLELQSVILKDF